MVYLVSTYILAALIGLCVGSFLNVVIYRVPNGMSIAKPGSHCTSCGYMLRPYDNIPVISYITLGGKCRKCKSHISFRYTAVELANMALWVLSVFMFYKSSFVMMLIAMAASSVFICIFFIDLEHRLIFDRFQLMVAALGIVAMFFDARFGLLSHIIGGVAGFLVFYLVSFGFEKLCGREGLGGGDVKLAGAAGLLLGWERLLLGVAVASIPCAIIMLIAKRGRSGEDREFPFAPFLSVGFLTALFFGSQIIDAYLSLLNV